jgi:amino acid adenylation domain-containing protein
VHAASHGSALPPELTARLRAAAGGLEVTLFSLLLAAFAVLLHRLSDERDLLVGVPAAGRTPRWTSGLVGYFVQPVAVRLRLAAARSFAAWTRRVQQALGQALAGAEYPLLRLMERLEVERDAGRAALFQVLVSPLEATGAVPPGLAPLALGETGGRLPFADLGLDSLRLDERRSEFDLTLMLAEVGGSLRLSLVFNTELFDAATAARWSRHLVALVESAAADLELPVGSLPLLRPAERLHLLVEWSDTAAAWEAGAAVPLRFLARARGAPEAAALVFGDEWLSYGEVARRSQRLASRLRRGGLGPETCVGVSLEHQPELVVALLGSLAAGCAYVPLDPAFPPQRLAFIAADAGLHVVLTGARQHRSVAALPVACLPVATAPGDEPAAPAGEAPSRPPAAVHPENLAYVIYTSGSTGRPKGVQVPHGALSNLLRSVAVRPGFGSRGVLLALTTPSFDIAAVELFLPLLEGGRVVLGGPELARDPQALAAAGERCAASLVQATPATWRALVEAGWNGGRELVLFSTGEALPADLAPRLLARCGSLWNLYGPTETTIWSTVQRLAAPTIPVPIGRPVANTRIQLLDRELRPVPIGRPGELYVGGRGLARGYLGRPALTAGSFLPDPFGPRGGDRLYRTRDVGRWRPDGELEYLGRSDHQVKLRGYRIELGELEVALAQAPAVRQAAVAVVGQGAEALLVAYLVTEGEGPLAIEELRANLAARLPEYMIPVRWVRLAELPKTPNRKLDRRALPAPPAEQEAGDGSFIEPSTVAESRLAGLFAELLGLRRVGAEDDFFRAGGHSLLATRLAARIRQEFAVELPLSAVFDCPTPRRLAALLAAAPAGAAAPIPAAGRRFGEPIVASSAQQRLWYLSQLDPADPTYNMFGAVEIRGPLRLRALAAALAEIGRRHEVLRTRLVAMEGRAFQVVEAAAPAPLPVVDLSRLPATRRRRTLHGLCGATAERPFDLGRAPLLRRLVARAGKPENWLLFCLHHAVADGWSLGVLFGELEILYQAFSTGRRSPLAALPLQYGDFALWQQAGAEPKIERSLAFWRERLAGATTVLELPLDRSRSALRRHRGTLQGVRLPAPAVAALRQLAARQGATLFALVTGALAALLGRYGGVDDVVVGTPVANRERAELHGRPDRLLHQPPCPAVRPRRRPRL